jgi:2-dehydro-3-deoxy-D-gluconate 5-dehydrogenase
MTDLSAFSLEGRVAMVTGAAFGLGQAMSIALAKSGADIAAVDIISDLNETRRAVEATGHRFHGIIADLSKVESIAPVIDETLKVYDRFHILINNAGIIRRAPCLEFNAKDWDEVMDVNARVPFFLAQAAARVFLKQGTGGKIINICSMLSFQGGILIPSYTASKSALAGITKAMANEWAARGINVNAIAPGYIKGRGNQALRDDPARNRQILERIPAGRWGEPSDLGGLAVFLSSAASDYCHGGIYPLDGGWLAR